MLQKGREAISKHPLGSFEANLRKKPLWTIDLEVAAGFPEPHIVLTTPYPPQLPNPEPAGTCCPGQSSGRAAGPSSRTGLEMPEVTHMTTARLGDFARPEAGRGFHWSCRVQLG